MRINFIALYQKAILGGIGGLIGWALISWGIPASGSATMKTFISGAFIGAAIGAACGAYEGAFCDRLWRRAIRGAVIGVVIGLFAGPVGIWAGDAVFAHFGSSVPILPRSIGWAILGLLVGTTEGIAKQMRQKVMFGAFGGLLGGLVGGSAYEWITTMIQFIGLSRGFALSVGGALGLILLGAFIGALVGLVENLLRTAWLTFTSGRLEGQTRTLDPTKLVTTIGRLETSDICVLADPDIVAEHARIVMSSGRFVLEGVNGRISAGPPGSCQPVSSYALSNGDMLQLGGALATFNQGD